MCTYVTSHQHISYMLHTGKHPVSHPSYRVCMYIHMFVCLFVCISLTLSLSLALHKLCWRSSWSSYSYLFTLMRFASSQRSIKNFSRQQQIKLANTHNFFLYERKHTHAYKQATTCIRMYIHTYVRVRVFIHEVRRMREYGNFTMAKLESQCVHVCIYIRTYIRTYI